MVNDCSFRSPNGMVDQCGCHTGSCSRDPGGWTRPLYGASNNATHSTSICAGAMQGAETFRYLDLTETNATHYRDFPGPFTATEWEAGVGAHEAAHQHGIGGSNIDEMHAWYYAMRAINNYRGGAGHGC